MSDICALWVGVGVFEKKKKKSQRGVQRFSVWIGRDR